MRVRFLAYLSLFLKVVAAVGYFHKFRALIIGLVRGVECEHQVALIGVKQHTVTSVIINKGVKMFKAALDGAIIKPYYAFCVFFIYEG